MKFNTKIESEVEVIGGIEENKVGIDSKNLDFIVSILSTNLYSYPINSFLRETVSNAFDSHIEANIDEPVLLFLNKDSEGDYYCEVQDFGVGLSPERFDKIYKNIGSSTKRDSNTQIGGFGIGRFSALAYSETVNITSVYNGEKTEYLMYKDGLSLNISKLVSLPTEERNGVKVKIPVKTSDLNSFYSAIYKDLSLFNNLHVETENKVFNYQFNNQKIKNYDNFKVVKYDCKANFEFAKVSPNILLGKVVYPLQNDIYSLGNGLFDVETKVIEMLSSIYYKKHNIDIDDTTLNLAKNFILELNRYFPIYLKFNIGELNVVPNREQILMNNSARSLIFEKLVLSLIEIFFIIYFKNEKINFKDIKSYIDSKNGSVQVDCFNFNISYEGFKPEEVYEEDNYLFERNIINKPISKKYSHETLFYNKDYNVNILRELYTSSELKSAVYKPNDFKYYLISSQKIQPQNISNNDLFSLMTGIKNFGEDNYIILNNDEFNSLNTEKKKYLRQEYVGYRIVVLNRPLKEIKENAFNSVLKLCINYYKNGLPSSSYANNYGLRKVIKDGYSFKEVMEHIIITLKYYDDFFTNFIKKNYIKNVNPSVEFKNKEKQIKIDKALNRAKIDHSEILNTNVSYSLINSHNINNHYFDSLNLTSEDIHKSIKKNLIVFSSKDDKRCKILLEFFNTNFKNPIKTYQVAKTKVKRLDLFAEENKNIVNIENFMRNPKKYKTIRDLGTAYLIHSEFPEILKMYNCTEFKKILEEVNKELFNNLEIILKHLKKYRLNLFEVTDKSHLDFARECYDICSEENMFNFEILASYNMLKAKEEAVRYLYDLIIGFKDFYSVSYTNTHSIGFNNNLKLISSLVSKALLKSKLLRPDYQNIITNNK